MEVATRGVRIGTWQGTAFLHEDRWYVRPHTVAVHLGLHWATQSEVINRNYQGALVRMRLADAIGYRRVLLMMRVGTAVVWVARMASTGRLAPETRARVDEMQMALAQQVEERIDVFFEGSEVSAAYCERLWDAPAVAEKPAGLFGRLFGRKAVQHG
jgi:hypothetical protein